MNRLRSPDEEQSHAANEREEPKNRPDVGSICDVGGNETNAEENKGNRQNIDGGLRRAESFSDQNTCDEDRQSLEAVELRRMSPPLPPLEICQPLSRVLVVEAALAPRLSETTRLRDSCACNGKKASNEDAGVSDGHVDEAARVVLVGRRGTVGDCAA